MGKRLQNKADLILLYRPLIHSEDAKHFWFYVRRKKMGLAVQYE